jgi:hypothetical protein
MHKVELSAHQLLTAMVRRHTAMLKGEFKAQQSKSLWKRFVIEINHCKWRLERV